MLCPFQCSIPLPFKNSQFLWMLATLTGGKGANLCSDPKLCSVAATTAGENQRGWIREIFPPAKKISDKTFQRENKRKKKIFVYTLHKCSVSILRTLPCLQRHVLPSPAGPSSGSRLCCPWGHCSCTASCAMATLTTPQLMAPVLWASTQSSRKQGFLPLPDGDRDVTLWTCEGLWNKRSGVSRAFTSGSPKIVLHGTGYIIQPCFSNFAKEEKATSENVLVNLIHLWL